MLFSRFLPIFQVKICTKSCKWLLCISISTCAQDLSAQSQSKPQKSQSVAALWADSLLNQLSEHEKLAQLLVLEADSMFSFASAAKCGGSFLPLPVAEAGSTKVPLWQADSLQIVPFSKNTAQNPLEKILFSISDTAFLQKMGAERALDYRQQGVSLLDISNTSLFYAYSPEKQAVAHYLKGLCQGDVLHCASTLNTSAKALKLNLSRLGGLNSHSLQDTLPLVRTKTYKKALAVLNSRLKRRDFSKNTLNVACKKILMQKYRYLIETRSFVPPRPFALRRRHVLQKSLTLLRHKTKILPLEGLDTLKIASIAFTKSTVSPFFFRRISDYLEMRQYLFPPQASAIGIKSLTDYDYLIVSIHAGTTGKKGFSVEQLEAINSLKQANVIWVFFGKPSDLQTFPALLESNVLVLAQENSKTAQDLAAQGLFGGIGFEGHLSAPVPPFEAGEGQRTRPNGSFSFVLPSELGVNAEQLRLEIEDIVQEGLWKGAFPGCQVLLAKDGRVFFYESYGHHTYKKKRAVKRHDLYDLASITKVIGPTMALMELYDKGIFSIDAQLFDYLPEWKRRRKGRLYFRNMLAHHAGLAAWIPYYKKALRKDGKRKRHAFSKRFSTHHPTIINENLYLHKNFKRVIYKQINASKIDKKGYKYSGLPFYLLPEVITRLGKEPYDELLWTHFFAPLGAKTVDFIPRRRFPLWRIVPTEQDMLFRGTLLHGWVHDEGAAMMGGISGNAGLFGKAMDVAKIWQMYLQSGYYGGKRYLSPGVIDLFTGCHFCEEDNRRGLGFDRPLIHYEEAKSSVPQHASQRSFGHTGYTGTMSWADPQYGLLFIFLSNRVHPTRDNDTIYELNLRPRLHKAVYESLCVADPEAEE